MTRHNELKPGTQTRYPIVLRVCISEDMADELAALVHQEELTESAVARRLMRSALNQLAEAA